VAGESLAFSFDGPANRPFALLQGPLNRNNDIIPNVGSLDIGMMGNISVYSDLAILLDGVFPVTFLDQLAKVGPSGSQTLSFPVPNLPPGSLGTLQALFWDVPSVTLKLSAATEINIQ
ncbi:MAG: hypothetical protein KDB53_12230, partial [Planctomycetes bacterium]|nr:hypothetical protein [Planctomycetota bacterium]